MDRLICGDVGYGKTELAMRAAFKAVDDGKQVAVLVPDDHAGRAALPHLLRSAWPTIPFTIEVAQPVPPAAGAARDPRARWPRARSTSSSARTGSSRRTSQFKDLGLVIIDEEQRFGVEHKEQLKTLRQTVDVLTLTATPIPRTLHMSPAGHPRHLATWRRRPPDRLAIETHVTPVRSGD